ncbi:alpha/beta hydrolase domain-containing protein [Methylorubrum salsuginis]|uniref:Alpha/beta hydrolase domain-containing protein n=1 Tax=Methylorubrum salsuginis TaxID=414703 RepID=A0A1I4K1U1_9HYPH|nr:alpha/beta hydrolase domain-containing protein [Methylorubrum salsuginis]SFL72760.1 hypothetical protein SAMN04488125_12265 [Methylorubrum salsuginis]
MDRCDDRRAPGRPDRRQIFSRTAGEPRKAYGNDVAGIRLPAVAAPRATYTGWNLYADPFPADALCDREGSEIPFSPTQAERIAKGDPRVSIEERYPDAEAYVTAVTKSVDALVADRLLLREDGDRMIEAARQPTP